MIVIVVHSDRAIVADGCTIEVVLTSEDVQEDLFLEFNLSGAIQMSSGESQTLYILIFIQLRLCMLCCE